MSSDNTEPRNGFISFLYALVVSFGAALAVDWYSTSQIEGVNISLIAAVIMLIIITYTFIRNGKNHIGESLKIALVLAGALVIIMVLDWTSKNITALTVPFFFLFIILIPINFSLWRKRYNITSVVMIIIAIVGWLAFFNAVPNLLPNENMTIIKYILLFKGIFNE